GADGRRCRRGDGLLGARLGLFDAVDRHVVPPPSSPMTAMGPRSFPRGTGRNTRSQLAREDYRSPQAPSVSYVSSTRLRDSRARTNSTGVVPWRHSGTPERARKRNFPSTPGTTGWSRGWAPAAWAWCIWRAAPRV